jgi:hypothetical protein
MLKNTHIKPITHSSQLSNKPKKMQKRLKNDFDLLLYVENLSKKNQMPGE